MGSWNSENLRVWKVWLNGIQKIEELNSIIFKAWKVWLYGIQKIEEFNSMVFTTWKLWFYGIQKIEEFKSMVFKAWRGQNLLMGTLMPTGLQANMPSCKQPTCLFLYGQRDVPNGL